MFRIASFLWVIVFLFSFKAVLGQPNILTEKEKEAGWRLLFDGKTTNGWRGTYIDHFPSHGWEVKDGILSTIPHHGENRNQRGGSIITTEKFEDFELYLECKFDAGVNSGIKYYVLELDPPNPRHGLGLEYQIWDNQQARDANKMMACLYDLIIADNPEPALPGVFHQIRIISKNNQVEHWLNGKKVLSYRRGSPEYRQLVAESKYKDIPAFGEATEGHILLQDEGGPAVSFRNIKIRPL
ncbi:MAG: 3-keto-disaccharide hydrolase [Candidatus Cyclobacteriaceae bacterium M3_2C_046]